MHKDTKATLAYEKLELYNYRIFRFFKTASWSRFQWLSPEKIKQKQEKKLKKILQHATKNVPFYQKFRKTIDFDNFCLEELQKLPVVDKEMIRNDYSSFYSSKRCLHSYSSTSGSSGHPFAFRIGTNSPPIESLTFERAMAMGKEYHYKHGDPIIYLRSYAPKDNEPIFSKEGKDIWYLSPFHINNQNIDKYVEIIHTSKAQIMRAYPSSLYLLTLLLEENNFKPPPIKALCTSSETLLPMFREKIEQYWQIPVLDWYGQNERTVTINQCWAGNYHNNDDYGVIEVDSDRNIIATSLHNFSMPFIRYNTGDKAILLDSPVTKCPCGRSLSIPLKGIEGRSDDLLVKEDGTKIPTVNIYTIVHELGFIKQFQIIQRPDLSIIFQAVGDLTKKNIEKLRSEIKIRFGDIPVTIVEKKSIERDTKTGKIKTIIQQKNAS